MKRIEPIPTTPGHSISLVVYAVSFQQLAEIDIRWLQKSTVITLLQISSCHSIARYLVVSCITICSNNKCTLEAIVDVGVVAGSCSGCGTCKTRLKRWSKVETPTTLLFLTGWEWFDVYSYVEFNGDHELITPVFLFVLERRKSAGGVFFCGGAVFPWRW